MNDCQKRSEGGTLRATVLKVTPLNLKRRASAAVQSTSCLFYPPALKIQTPSVPSQLWVARKESQWQLLIYG